MSYWQPSFGTCQQQLTCQLQQAAKNHVRKLCLTVRFGNAALHLHLSRFFVVSEDSNRVLVTISNILQDSALLITSVSMVFAIPWLCIALAHILGFFP